MRPLAIALLVSFTVAAGCSGGTEPGATPSTPVSSSPSGRPASDAGDSHKVLQSGHVLYYLKGTTLHALDLASMTDDRIREVPTADVALSRNARYAAFVVPTAPGGDEDFVNAPAVYLLDLATGERRNLGPGFGPTFNPSGDLVAWLRPSEGRTCEAETCSGSATVMMGGISQNSSEVLPEGEWTILEWSGERVLVAGANEPKVVAVALDGSVDRLDVNAKHFWGASPDGSSLVTTFGQEVVVTDVSDHAVTTRLDLGGTLGEGAWSPTADLVAAVRLGKAVKGVPQSDLVTIEPGSDRVRKLPGSEGAVGQVRWAPDASELAYVRGAPPRGLNLEAVVCSNPPRGPCKPLFSWRRGVLLLRLT